MILEYPEIHLCCENLKKEQDLMFIINNKTYISSNFVLQIVCRLIKLPFLIFQVLWKEFVRNLECIFEIELVLRIKLILI